MGANRHLGIGKESTFNTPVAPLFLLEAISESLKLDPTFEDTTVMRQCEMNDSVLINLRVRGTVEAYLNYQHLATFLHWIIGSTSSTGAGPFTHNSPAVSSGSLSTRPSLTVEIQRDGSGFTWKYAGCVLTELSISVAQNQRALVTLGFLGASETNGSPTASPIILDQDHVLPKHVLIKDVSTEIPADTFSLTIERPLDETIRLGDDAFTALPKDEGIYSVSGEATLRPADLTVYDKFVAGTLIDLAVVLQSSGAELVTLNMNKSRLQQMTPEVSGRDPLTFPMSFKSIFDTAVTSSLHAVSTNDVADPSA